MSMLSGPSPSTFKSPHLATLASHSPCPVEAGAQALPPETWQGQVFACMPRSWRERCTGHNVLAAGGGAGRGAAS